MKFATIDMSKVKGNKPFKNVNWINPSKKQEEKVYNILSKIKIMKEKTCEYCGEEGPCEIDGCPFTKK